MWFKEIEHNDRHLIFHAESERRRVHHLQLLCKSGRIRHLLIALGIFVFYWILVVDAIDLGCFQNNLHTHFVGAECCSRVGRKIGVTGSGGEDHHAPFLKVAHRSAANKRFGNLGHIDGTLNSGLDAFFLQSILQSKSIDDRSQHSHVIASSPFDTFLAPSNTPENIATSHHDHHFNS